MSQNTAYLIGRALGQIPLAGWLAGAIVFGAVGYNWTLVLEEESKAQARAAAAYKPLPNPHGAQIAAAAEQARIDRGPTIGMTASDVLKTKWGTPQSINRTQSSTGSREQWVYGNGHYLYFRNGVLHSITTRE